MVKINKLKEISVMNAFLCLCVVAVHLTVEPMGLWSYGTFRYLTVFVINRILCFAVPAFLFLSGLKLHHKFDKKSVDVKKFYVNRLKKLVLPYIVCVLVYFVYLWWKGWVEPKYLPGYIFLGTLVAHCYYIVIAVQLYALFPLLKKVFERFPKTVTVLSLILTVVMIQFVHIPYVDRFAGTYIFYFVFGMFFSKYKLYDKLRNSGRLYLLCFVCFLILAVVHMRYLYLQMVPGYVYFGAELMKLLFVFCAIMFLYGTFQRLADRFSVLVKVSEVINDTSYSIYLYHILLLYLLRNDLLKILDLTVWGRLAVATVVMYGSIFVYSWGVRYLKTRAKQNKQNSGSVAL